MNLCSSLCIDIPSIPALVEPNEKAFFAWDEPQV